MATHTVLEQPHTIPSSFGTQEANLQAPHEVSLQEKSSDETSPTPPKPKEGATIDIERKRTVTSSEEGNVKTSTSMIEDRVVYTTQVQDHSAADAFGDESNAQIQYKTMEWWHCGILMVAENISLGVLALPQAVAWLGLVPGLLLVFVLGIIAGYTGFIIGQFKQKYPQVTQFSDVGEIIAGTWGRRVMATGQLLILIFIQAAHVLSFAIAMNVLTDHSMCTVAFAVFGMIICFMLGLPRTLKNVAMLSCFSCASVFASVIVVMIAVGIAKPDMGHAIAVNPNMSVVQGLTPVMNIVLAYAGHVGFFSFASELKDPRDYNKALLLMQTSAVTFYMVISTVIYFYVGPHVASPALASASPIVRKIAFGIALPTIIVAGVINGSVSCKYLYMRFWKGTDVIHQNSFKAIGSWIAVCALCWIVAWVIAEAIPNFNSLLALIASVFGSWFSYGLPSGMWLYMNKGTYTSTRLQKFFTVLNIGIFCLGFAMCAVGLWNSGFELAHGAAGKPFSCANNWKHST